MGRAHCSSSESAGDEMNAIELKDLTSQRNKSERGAALITVLMFSALLLTAGGALILTTSLAGTNTVDAAAEMQAYYGAEAGIQAALNVMRGNVMPNPLFASNPVGGVAPENKITFFKSKTNSWSNLASDPTTGGFSARLSRWISYNYTPAGGSYADRVSISPGYNPFSGIAYSLVITDPDNKARPTRLLVTSTGYGPRGARKTLSLLLTTDVLNISIPAALVFRGHDDHVTPVNLILGSSNAKTYSGVDASGLSATKPTLAVSNHDVTTAQAAYSTNPNTVSDPKYNILNLVTTGEPAPAGPLAVAPPWFLDTADAARTFLAQAEALAQKKGKVLASLNGAAGAIGAPEFTVVKGDCNLNGGAGLLIVEGDLTMAPSGPDFNGIILVLGKGTVNKNGGGNRTIYGSLMVAHFNGGGNFLQPTFNYGTGAGNSTVQYDSQAIADAIELTAPLVLGVVEK
jgi:hypothetical protein